MDVLLVRSCDAAGRVWKHACYCVEICPVIGCWSIRSLDSGQNAPAAVHYDQSLLCRSLSAAANIVDQNFNYNEHVALYYLYTYRYVPLIIATRSVNINLVKKYKVKASSKKNLKCDTFDY